jgi:ferredoxin
MKVKIDQLDCIECGECADACPMVFVFRIGGKAKISETYQSKGSNEGIISSDLKDCVSKAALKCPVNVITII